MLEELVGKKTKRESDCKGAYDGKYEQCILLDRPRDGGGRHG